MIIKQILCFIGVSVTMLLLGTIFAAVLVVLCNPRLVIMDSKQVWHYLRRFSFFTYAKVGAIILLLLALVPQYREFYVLLRWLICPVLAVLSYQAYSKKLVSWAWGFGIAASIFNPISPFHLGDLWLLVDFVVAGLVIASFFVLKAET